MPKTKPSLLDPEMFPSEKPTRNFNFKPEPKHIPWIIVGLVVLAAAIFGYMQYRSAQQVKQQLEELKKDPTKANQEETQELLEKVGKLIELPKEQPTIATVTDLAPLKDQPFFANAQVGDKVLIYSQAKKAILYRPSTNKVIEIAPVDLNNQSSSSTNSNTNRPTNSNRNANTNSNND